MTLQSDNPDYICMQTIEKEGLYRNTCVAISEGVVVAVAPVEHEDAIIQYLRHMPPGVSKFYFKPGDTEVLDMPNLREEDLEERLKN